MRLTFNEINRGHKDYREIKEMYLSAFPLYERMPFWYMARKARREDVKLLGVYDGQELVGMLYIMEWRDIVYIQYFAVAEGVRGKGYGSGILSALKESYKDCRFVLEIEEVAKDAPNYEERERRKAFYERNGFYDMGLLLSEAGVRYYFMTIGGFEPSEYLAMTRAFRGRILSLVSTPRIEKRGA